ncbi:MAG: SRPBCC family protein [Actinomycetes bacterium]
MNTFDFTVGTTLPPERAFDVATDWHAHSRLPLTTVYVKGTGRGVGARFVGRTGVGRLSFDDPMEVVEWSEPSDGGKGHCRLVKTGKVVYGGATIDVTPGAAGGSVVSWRETADLAVGWLNTLLGPAIRLGAPVVFRWVLRTALRKAERGS